MNERVRNKEKRLTELKITQERLKKAEKRITELDIVQNDIQAFDAHVQTNNPTVEKAINTDLTQEKIKEEHERIKNLTQENS